MNKKNKDFYRSLTLVVVGVLLYWGLNKYKTVEHWLAVFAEIFASFAIGCVIALVLDVPMSFIERKIFGEPGLGEDRGAAKHKLARPLSITLTLIGCAGAVTLMLSLLIPSIKSTAMQLYEQIPGFINRVFDMAKDNKALGQYLKKTGLSATDVINTVTEKLSDGTFISRTLSGMMSVASGTVTGVANFFIGLVFAIYMLAQKETLKNQMSRICSAYLPMPAAERLTHVAKVAKANFSSFISGQSLEAVILGTLCGVGMSLLRLPYSATIGVLVAVTAFIPIVGAFLGIGIGAFLILITSFKQAVIFVVYMVILQQIEGNLIYPKVVGKSVGLPSLWVLFAITVGGSVGGIMGMFLAVPVMSVLYCLIGDSVDERNARRAAGVPVMKEDIAPPPAWLTEVDGKSQNVGQGKSDTSELSDNSGNSEKSESSENKAKKPRGKPRGNNNNTNKRSDRNG